MKKIKYVCNRTFDMKVEKFTDVCTECGFSCVAHNYPSPKPMKRINKITNMVAKKFFEDVDIARELLAKPKKKCKCVTIRGEVCNYVDESRCPIHALPTKEASQDLSCPNGYEGEGMKCCRCVRPQYPKPKKKCCKAHDAGFAGPHCNNPVPSPTKEVESWEDDDMFLDPIRCYKWSEIKDFIRKTLSQSRKEVLKQFIKEVEFWGINVVSDWGHKEVHYYPAIEENDWKKLKAKLNKLK